MSNRFGSTVLGLIAFGSMAQAQVTQIMVPGTNSPTDIQGNRAIANAPKPGQSDHTEPSPATLESWAPFGPSGADTQSMAASPTAPGVVIAGVGSALGGGGVYVTGCDGCFWQQASGTGNRTVNEVEFASTGRGWAATEDGLFTSTDNGNTWTEVFLPIAGQALVQDVFVDPSNPSTIWVGLGQFFGGTSTQLVFKSTDDGANWTDLSPPVGSGLGATVVAVDPANPQHVYAAFTGNFGFGNELWITTNGGTSWEERSAGVPNNIINDIAFSGNTAYIAGGQDFGSQFLGLYSTTDDGFNWNNLSSEWPSTSAMAVTIDPSNPQKILAGTTRGGLVVSTDGGATWSYSVGNTGTYQVNDIEYVPGSSSNLYLGLGSVAVLRSTNGGTTFNPAAGGISRLEITSFAVNPLNTSEIAASYVGQNDGGIFVSTDAGETWTLANAPLPRWQKVYFSPQGTLYASHDGPLGRGDDGLWVRGAGDTWTNMGPGSPSSLDNIGLDIAVATGPNPVILWTGYRWLPQPQSAEIWSYNRVPNTWVLEYNSTQFGEYANSVTFMNNGAGPGAVVGQISFGQDGVGAALYSTDNGDNWSLAQTWSQPNWHVWDVSRGPGDTVYALASANTGNNPSSVFKSTDGGANWTQQGTYPGGRTMVADPNVAGTLYSYPTFDNPIPHRSTDDGASFQPFAAGFLSNVAGRDMVYGGVVNGRSRLYIASSAGGFATDLGVAGQPPCSADFNGDGDFGTDADIEAWFSCLAGNCCPACGTSDYNGDGDFGTDGDIEAFFRVLAGNPC